METFSSLPPWVLIWDGRVRPLLVIYFLHPSTRVSLNMTDITSSSLPIFRDRPVQGVLFDMDGVIADTRDAHLEAWRRFLKKYDRGEVCADFFHWAFGRGNREIFEERYPEFCEDEALFLEKSGEKEDLFLDNFRNGMAPALPGLKDFIAAISDRGVKLAVGSSAPRGNIDVVLETLGITDAFSIIVSSEDAERAKPDPEIFLKAAAGLGLAPEDCVVLEDSTHGLVAARRAGMRIVGVTSMHTAEEIADMCDIAVADYHELIKAWGMNSAS